MKESLDLNNLNIYKNPINNPPYEILLKGNNAIKEWFEDEDRVPVNEVKVLLVGHGEVGKTTLIKCLIGQHPKIGESVTDQIQVTSHIMKIKNKKIRLNFWDFGGQEIMHSTHQFFLTKRSIYILVLDGRRDEDPEYWLKHIESFGGDSPVLLVMNKIADNPIYDVNRQFLIKKYPFIIGFYKTECIKQILGIDDLRKGLGLAINKVKIVTTLWPKNWFRIKKIIESSTDDIISQDQYEEICQNNGINDANTKDILAGFLNDLGSIVHFDEPELTHLHILQPRWASGAVIAL